MIYWDLLAFYIQQNLNSKRIEFYFGFNVAIFVVYFLAYVSRWFILFLLQLSELFLFPTFNKTRGIFLASVFPFSPSQPWDILFFEKFVTYFRHQKELHICGFYSHLEQSFRDHCLLQKSNQRSNNTVDEGFSPMKFCIDKYLYFCHKLVSNYCRPIFRATYSIFHIYLIRCFMFISSSNILSQGTSLLVTPDWLCPLASVMGASFVFVFVLTRGSINSPICHAAQNKCVRPTIS